MANRGFDDCKDRFGDAGPTGTQRDRPTDPTGELFAKVPKSALRAETRANQFRHGGWDKYEMPTGNDGPVDSDELPQVYARGGNADTHLSADYPGGTTA
jgi:hypothetical protein